MLIGKIPDPFGPIAHDNLLIRAAPAALPGFHVDSFAKLFGDLDGAGVGSGIGIADGVTLFVPFGLGAHTESGSAHPAPRADPTARRAESPVARLERYRLQWPPRCALLLWPSPPNRPRLPSAGDHAGRAYPHPPPPTCGAPQAILLCLLYPAPHRQG